jgi:AtzE family amidohydrolase
MMDLAAVIASKIRTRQISAVEVTRSALQAIHDLDPKLNCFTSVMEQSALDQAASVDAQIAARKEAGPLAGVPFAVKNLFDIAGITTLAGSKILAGRAPAQRDATAVARLKKAGAVLIGALNMDEFAYGFTTENTHYGPTHNPHDTDRVAGGSSGGSAAAVAACIVPLSLGSDTNGSIRVPAAFCGIFGLKPTYGRISRAGTFMFAESFDHVGPFARSVQDITAAFDVLNGPDLHDPVCSDRAPESIGSQLDKGTEGLRIAIANDSYFEQGHQSAVDAVHKAAKALNVDRTVNIPDIERARSAAYVITACEGASLHLPDLRTRPGDFDPVVVDRFLAGAVMPAVWYLHAQRFRTVFREKMRALFRSVDVILVPSTPFPAINIGQEMIVLGGKELPSRPNIGMFTQPFSFVGLPIISVPIFEEGALPLGVQVIAAPYQEQAILRVARQLERSGVSKAHRPVMKAAV